MARKPPRLTTHPARKGFVNQRLIGTPLTPAMKAGDSCTHPPPRNKPDRKARPVPPIERGDPPKRR